MSTPAYLQATAPAVRHLFDGLNSFEADQLPSIAQYIDDSGLVRMSKAEVDQFTQVYADFFALEFARATLAGSILQVAYVGLKRHSTNQAVTQACSSLGVSQASPLARLCVGREVHGIPIGLLIYAGRIQYNHWEDGEPSNPVAQSVMRQLYSAYSSDLTFDMAYDLEYPEPRPVSHYILRLELKWRHYEDYLRDMSPMLPS